MKGLPALERKRGCEGGGSISISISQMVRVRLTRVELKPSSAQLQGTGNFYVVLVPTVSVPLLWLRVRKGREGV